jgi:hypothetical protein
LSRYRASRSGRCQKLIADAHGGELVGVAHEDPDGLAHVTPPS